MNDSDFKFEKENAYFCYIERLQHEISEVMRQGYNAAHPDDWAKMCHLWARLERAVYEHNAAVIERKKKEGK